LDLTNLVYIKPYLPKNATNSYITQFCTISKFINSNIFLVVYDQFVTGKIQNETNKKIKEHSVYIGC
ncbi:hypothetical protein ABEZ87_28830, partial [Bacillus mycoides]|uniref:hypothetical protein n=1 Tax=Bacillus mycoides TaxID=1405 RepID=UPI003D220995